MTHAGPAGGSVNIKRSVSLGIHDPRRPGAVLLVQRPDDDEDLPGAWGLPAASLAEGETWEAAALRAGREKLGVALQLGGALREGKLERAAYTLHMRLYEATVTAGTPTLAGAPAGMTRYQAWRWGDPAELWAAADAGSLCSRLYLGWLSR